ncbi:MAG: hypothetical protein E7515_00070 [Ruminococcaceae bacterium]|jgi:stage IV sporulation protein FB|nr:hypothetical protein [Oscillospiraceae bacterium]
MKFRTKYFLLVISPLFFAVITVVLTLISEPTVIIALVSSVLHECGHLFVLLRFKSEIKSVTLSFYGMKIIRQNEIGLSLKKEIAVCFAGITVNFIICVLFFLVYQFYKYELLLKISAVNFILGFFNALPVYSLDGGRGLNCFLNTRFDIIKSEKISKMISLFVISPMIALSVYYLVKYSNFTLLICCIYLLASSYCQIQV